MARVITKSFGTISYINFFSNRSFILLRIQCCNISDQTKPPDPQSPLEILKQKTSKGDLMNDPHQVMVTEALQKVYQEMKGYEPEKPGILSKWIGRSRKKKKVPKGLYIYGAVGGGKTMLMDLFYNCCQVFLSFSISIKLQAANQIGGTNYTYIILHAIFLPLSCTISII